MAGGPFRFDETFPYIGIRYILSGLIMTLELVTQVDRYHIYLDNLQDVNFGVPSTYLQYSLVAEKRGSMIFFSVGI